MILPQVMQAIEQKLHFRAGHHACVVGTLKVGVVPWFGNRWIDDQKIAGLERDIIMATQHEFQPTMTVLALQGVDRFLEIGFLGSVRDNDLHPAIEKISSRSKATSEATESHDDGLFVFVECDHYSSLALFYYKVIEVGFRYNCLMKPDAFEANESRQRHLLPFIALASSLVLCCPMTSLMGFVLGLISLRRIQASGGMLGGKRIAKIAMILGIVMVPVQYFLLDSFQKMNERLLQEGLGNSMSILFDVDAQDRPDALLRIFSTFDGKRPSESEIEAFVSQVTSTLGEYQGLSVIRSTPGKAGFLDRSYEIAVGFRFIDQTVTGGVECMVIPSGTTKPHAILFQRIELQIQPEVTLKLPAGSGLGPGTEIDSDADSGSVGVEETSATPNEES